MKTEKRIEQLAVAVYETLKNIDRNVVVADIATDHGYLAEKISHFENVDKVIATDISEKSLNKLVKLKKEKGLDKILTIVGDGLNPIERVDLAVIAGIGGFEIINILRYQNVTEIIGEPKCRYFVLQPAQNIVELRKFLFENKYKILSDSIVQDGKQFYPIVCIDVMSKQKNKCNTQNLWIGTHPNFEDKDFVSFLYERLETLKFVDDLPQKRFKNDENLRQKRKLKKIIAKMIKKTKQ